MNQKKMLTEYIEIANIHAHRLQISITESEKLFPISKDILNNLSSTELAFIDMLTTRFSKLQDIIGSKIFPITLNLLGEDEITLIDRLNKLEKIKYIDSASWWMELRESRNQITHDYPNNQDVLASHLNIFQKYSKELLAFWNTFQNKISFLQN